MISIPPCKVGQASNDNKCVECGSTDRLTLNADCETWTCWACRMRKLPPKQPIDNPRIIYHGD